MVESLVWTSNHRLELCETEEPQIAAPDEVKIRIEMTGICGTDLAVITGKEEGIPGIIRGHEAVGTVVAIGSAVDRVKVGDRVVIDPNQSCGECYFCRKKQPHLCTGTDGKGMPIAGLNRNGTFTFFFITVQTFAHPIPDDMSWETAVMIEPLACVLHNFHEAEISPDDKVLVLGSGPMGLLCQMVSRSKAALTAATEINPYRLAAAREISDYALTPSQLNEGIVHEICSGRKFDLIIDTVGNQLETAEQWIERGGRIVPFGINAKYQYTFSPTKFVQNAIKIIGAGEYRYMFEEALQFAAGTPDLGKLVTRKVRLNQYEAAINELLGYDLNSMGEVRGETLKTVFAPWT
ncbi:Zn-dependent alcohol dehydrogenase [Paenibacillus sambharensis]|uniref:Zn-dependent alcohol dehydrogenase n=1 Tax=Paenibacillus sambharensis TaxID=1803190 RepID=A0A2W1LCV8_9BACL|nr:alcohol dehydrogenase catalytic domain-containing protein [Paenibacillus sambharensis]PZD96499.1 Zn-dependent alcohol dehydrogenase [Paenibacillus sambharensis]